jgi:CBS domain-containing protein
MKVLVKELMTRDCKACDPSDSLASAAMRMWDGDCGILPVIEAGKVVGVITDRDICMALALKGCRPNEQAVGEVMTAAVHTCSPQDDVVEALATMGRRRVRRLVVVEGGTLAGMLSMNDVVGCAGDRISGPSRSSFMFPSGLLAPSSTTGRRLTGSPAFARCCCATRISSRASSPSGC